jgi:hypothetical protein
VSSYIKYTQYKKRAGESGWFSPAILATQEAEIRGITVKSQPRRIVLARPSLEKNLQNKGLVEWLKV